MSEELIELLKKVQIKAKPYRLTRYEKARIVAARALQLSLGAIPLLDIKNLSKDPVEIAKEELKRGVLPITVVRRLPSGGVELLPVSKLVELEKKIFGRVTI